MLHILGTLEGTNVATKKTARARASTDQDVINEIKGVDERPTLTATGGIYRGKFTCPDVQWTGVAPEVFGTFTITAQQLADAAGTGLLWTDQDVQRGVKPEASASATKELSLQLGFPDPATYVFDVEKAESITEQLLRGDRLFLSPLVWNLRPGAFEAYWNKDTREFFIYDGKVYLPDSHHRHQAIVKAYQAWRQAPKDYSHFSGGQQFKVELYFLSRQDEGNYFYAKNQLPKPTAKSKAFDLTTVDELSLLAKLFISKSGNLTGNVNRVTDRLSPKNPQVVTLSTVREMMKSFAPSDGFDEVELEGLATVAAQFYDLLAGVRPELGLLDHKQRRDARASSLVDSAVMMHGYASLMQDFNLAVAARGRDRALAQWRRQLERLSPNTHYKVDRWSGDFFDKRNPIWLRAGVVKPSRDERNVTVLNTGAARISCGRLLRRFLASDVAAGGSLKSLMVE